MRTFVMGDIHGAYKALLQCLERSSFDYENDRLIQLGGIVDGYPEVYECVKELLKLKKLIAIKGNHDDWSDNFIKSDFHPSSWTYGGKGTLLSYLSLRGRMENSLLLAAVVRPPWGPTMCRRHIKLSLTANSYIISMNKTDALFMADLTGISLLTNKRKKTFIGIGLCGQKACRLTPITKAYGFRMNFLTWLTSGKFISGILPPLNGEQTSHCEP